MKKKLFGIMLVMILATVGTYFYMKTRLRSDPHIVSVSGNVEIRDAEVSFKIPGFVEKRLVSEGERVERGQIVALLDSRELAQEVDLRKAEVRGAEAVLAKFEEGYRPEEIAQGEASLELANAEARRAEAEARRQERLQQKGATSTRDFESAKAEYEVTLARVREAREKLALLIKGPRVEDIAEARARLEQAQQARSLSETRLGYATLRSPLSGIVLSENVENGEYVAAGTPVVTVGELENVWLRAYIDETDLGRVKIGNKVRVATDTYRDRAYEGRISFISSEAEFTPKTVQTEKERVKLVYRIKVDIPNPHMELKPGMPADGEISLESRTASDGYDTNP